MQPLMAHNRLTIIPKTPPDMKLSPLFHPPRRQRISPAQALGWVLAIIMVTACNQSKSDCPNTLSADLSSQDLTIGSGEYSDYLMGVLTFYTTNQHHADGRSPASQCQALVRAQTSAAATEQSLVSADLQIFTSRQCLRPVASLDGEQTPLWLHIFVDQDATAPPATHKRPGFLYTYALSDDFHQLALKRSQFSDLSQLEATESKMTHTMMQHLWQSKPAEQGIPPHFKSFHNMFYSEMCQDQNQLTDADFSFVLRRLGHHSRPLGLGCYQALDLTMFTASAQLSSAQLSRLQATAQFIPIAAKHKMSSSPWHQWLTSQRFNHDLGVLDDLLASLTATTALETLATEAASALASVEIVPEAAAEASVTADPSMYVVSHHHALEDDGAIGAPLGVQTHLLSDQTASPAKGYFIHQTPWGLTAVQRIYRQFMDSDAPGASSQQITYHQGSILVAHDIPVGVLQAFHSNSTVTGRQHLFTPFNIREQDYLQYELAATSASTASQTDGAEQLIGPPLPTAGSPSAPKNSASEPAVDRGTTTRQTQAGTEQRRNSQRRGRTASPPLMITLPPFPLISGNPVTTTRGINTVSFQSTDSQNNGQPTVTTPDLSPIQSPPALTTPSTRSPRSADTRQRAAAAMDPPSCS